MKNLKPFQVIVFSIFGVSLVAGVIVLATYRGSTTAGSGVPVTVWGTIDSLTFSQVAESVIQVNKGLSVNYVLKKPEAIDKELVEALASGKGPDLVLLSDSNIVKYQNKIIPIPPQVLNERDFRTIFLPEAELFVTANGILAMPFSIDPLVMYWNRTVFNNAAIAEPPRVWDQFFTLATRLTDKDANLTIKKSAVALGEYSNISNAKEIISALLLQTGSPIVKRDQTGILAADFGQDQNISSAINFYTEFANPVKPIYSWNRSLPVSRSMFLQGNLGVYFGFASELAQLRERNPNLDFDVLPLPQLRAGNIKATYGKIAGFALLRGSQNQDDAIAVAIALTSQSANKRWVELSGLPPVRRDLLSAKQEDPYKAIFFEAALQAKGWLSPEESDTSRIFSTMISSITGGRVRTSEAVARAASDISNILRTQ